jgi:membrane-associated phospholipid phosphatase
MWTNKEEPGSRREKYKRFIKECRFHISLSLLVFVLYLTEASIQRRFMSPRMYYDATAFIEAIGSDSIHIFQEVVFPSLTYIMTVTYMVAAPFIILFTFVILGYYRETPLFKRYSLMISIDYLIAFPFFMFFNVSTTGLTLHTMQPLMYEQFPHIFSTVTAIDPLDNCFPSLHVTMVFSALLIILGTDFKRYKIFICVAFPIIVFSVLYLGIHWIPDVFAGMALALFTYYAAKSFCESS